MSDTFSEVTSQGWGGRLMQSIKGVLIGLLLFVAGFPLLFWNEGRAVRRYQDLKEGSEAVVMIKPDSVDAGNEGKLIHITSPADTKETLEDKAFGVSANAIHLQRAAEMYQWKENQKSETKKKLGGGEETVTTYSYEKTWGSGRFDSKNFKKKEGHENPPMLIQSKTHTAKVVSTGAFHLSEALISQIKKYEAVQLDADALAKVSDKYKETAKVNSNQFYVGKDPSAPAIGDIRVGFKVVKPTEVSFIASQAGDSFKPWTTPSGRALEQRLELGNVTPVAMFTQMEHENFIMTWVLRGVGFAMLAFGIGLILRPLVVVADVVPFIGSVLGGGVFIVSLLIALPCTLITVAVAWLFYRPVMAILLIAVALGAVYMLRRMRKKPEDKVEQYGAA
jgi:hypothetical protein